MFFAVLAVAGQIERNHIREKTLEGQVAAAKGNHGGRPKVIDDDSPSRLRPTGSPPRTSRRSSPSKTGKNAGNCPSVASLYRAFDPAEQAAADDDLPLRPKPARIRQADEPETPEQAALRKRLQDQVLQRRAGE